MKGSPGAAAKKGGSDHWPSVLRKVGEGAGQTNQAKTKTNKRQTGVATVNATGSGARGDGPGQKTTKKSTGQGDNKA